MLRITIVPWTLATIMSHVKPLKDTSDRRFPRRTTRAMLAGLLAYALLPQAHAALGAKLPAPTTTLPTRSSAAEPSAPSPVPSSFVTPTLTAVGAGLIPHAFTTPTLAAQGAGLIPAAFTTHKLEAVGAGFIPQQFTTPQLLAAGAGLIPSAFTTPALNAKPSGPGSPLARSAASALVVPMLRPPVVPPKSP